MSPCYIETNVIIESSVQVKGTVEAVTIPNLFPCKCFFPVDNFKVVASAIKENGTWLNTLDVRPGSLSGYKKVLILNVETSE